MKNIFFNFYCDKLIRYICNFVYYFMEIMAELRSIQAFQYSVEMKNKLYKPVDDLKVNHQNGTKIEDITLPMSFDQSYIQSQSLQHYGSLKPSSFSLHRPPVTIEWKNIELITDEGKPILKGISGVAKRSELTAIIGPSGAGKSTLLNILSGFTRKQTNGDILVNGGTCHRDKYKKLGSYVMQEDYLLPHLTVKETMNIAASLKIPVSVNNIEKQKIIDECIRTFGLTDCQNTRAFQLSGGERKRLSIAQDLVSNPSLIFLDEPTSGLDSLSCLQCIEQLKRLAQEGKTVVCVIHQPSSKVLEIFDKLYIMAKGVCIYKGPTKELVPFLASNGLECPQYHNPADFVTEVAFGIHGNWIEKLAKSTNFLSDDEESLIFSENYCQKRNNACNLSTLHLLEEEMKEKDLYSKKNGRKCDKEYETSYWHQFKILTHRAFICTLREPLETRHRFTSHLLFGIFMGLLYLDIGNKASKVIDNMNFLFVSILFMFFCALMPTTLTFSLEKSVFVREQSNCWYSSKTYFLAKTLAEVPILIICPVIYGSIVYWMTSQPPELFRFIMFLSSCIILCFCAQSFGLIIGTTCSMKNAVLMAPLASMPFYMLGGFFVRLNNPVLRSLSYASYVRYIYQSFLLTIYSMGRKELECDMPTCHFTDPMEIVRSVNMADESLYMDFIAQLIFVFLFRFIAYFTLWYKTIYKR